MPPVAVTVAEPLKSPLHVTFMIATDALGAEEGWVIVLLSENEQPAASVIVIEYRPAERPVIAKKGPLKLPDVVEPFGAVKL